MTRDFLAAIVGAETAGFVEIRHKQPNGTSWAQEFFGVRDIPAAADYVLSVGNVLDAYVGMAPRTLKGGRSQHVRRSWVVSADCDDDASVRALGGFEPRPSIVVRSGGITASGAAKLHAHWLLREPVDGAEFEDAKRKLAAALGSDRSICDAARIMRVPGTLNFKTSPPQPVVVEHFDGAARFVVGDVLANVEAPAPAVSPFRGGRGARPVDDVLLEIPAAEYVPLLSGRAVGHDGKACCPFHDDGTPSLHAYADPAKGWYCYGCRRGGSIYTFAAHMGSYPLPLRDANFKTVQAALYDFFLERAEAA